MSYLDQLKRKLAEEDGRTLLGKSCFKPCCSSCGGFYLHQGDVEVFNRCCEDAASGLHAVVMHDRVAIDTSMIGNPSERRQGLTISFTCETCHASPTLKIIQCKGETLIEWELQ